MEIPHSAWLELRGYGQVGIWPNLPDIHMAETFARLDVDWICFDLQHGLMDYSDLLRLLPAVCGLPVTPLVRVAANQPDQIGKALDAGAQGVIVPVVNSVADAQQAAAACRYPPQGTRSCGPMRDAMIEGIDYLATANEQVACVVMIETEEDLANVEAIAAVEGVDALFVGPMDLCYGLGLSPGQFADARFTDAITRILTACKAHGRAAGYRFQLYPGGRHPGARGSSWRSRRAGPGVHRQKIRLLKGVRYRSAR